MEIDLKICQCNKCKNCYFDSENAKKLCYACSQNIHKH